MCSQRSYRSFSTFTGLMFSFNRHKRDKFLICKFVACFISIFISGITYKHDSGKIMDLVPLIPHLFIKIELEADKSLFNDWSAYEDLQISSQDVLQLKRCSIMVARENGNTLSQDSKVIWTLKYLQVSGG